MDSLYRINEIFYSLQGEGHHTGTPAVFIRFSGCNLRCPFCDTDFASSRAMTLGEIMESAMRYPARFVVLTGGEPSLQADDALVRALHDAGFYIAIETNGTHALPAGIDWVTVSPKEGGKVVLTDASEVKVVFTGQEVERYHADIRSSHYYLQPCARTVDGDMTDNREEVIDYCMAHPHWHLSLQTHKLLGIR